MRALTPQEATRQVQASLAALPHEFDGCVMCAIARGAHDAAWVVKRVPGAVVVLDRFAARRGHLMVVLEHHAERLAELSWPRYQTLQRVAWEASLALEAVLRPKRTYVALLGSANAGEKSWPHLHLHVVPLDDEGESARPARVFSWSEALYTYDDAEAAELAAQLRAAWPAEAL